MKKDNKGLIVLIMILSILVIGLLSYLIYDKGIKVDEGENNLFEIADAELLVSLRHTIDSLEHLDFQTKPGWFYENDKTIIADLSEEQRILFTINDKEKEIYGSSIDIFEENEQYYYHVITENNLKNIFLNSGYITNENVLDNLKNLYGKSFKIPIYSDKYNGYLVGGSGGFIVGLSTYDYKFEKNEQANEYYLYRSVAVYDSTNHYEYKNIKKLEDKEINRDNYKEYSRFKFTFKNNILYSVEKVN